MNEQQHYGWAARLLHAALVVAGLIGAAQGLSAPAAAQAKSGALREACMDDYRRFCANVQRGGGRVRQCMLDNANQLTPQCRDSIKASQSGKPQ